MAAKILVSHNRKIIEAGGAGDVREHIRVLSKCVSNAIDKCAENRDLVRPYIRWSYELYILDLANTVLYIYRERSEARAYLTFTPYVDCSTQGYICL